jgi:hypothetical protein
MADKDPYVQKLEDLYSMSEEVQKANADQMKRWSEAVLSPSEEDLMETITGYPKRLAAIAAESAPAAKEEKDVAADKPAATYKTRDITAHKK